MSFREVSFDERVDRRSTSIALAVVIVATVILSVITANECHSTFVTLNKQVPYVPSLIFGFVMWAWWGTITIGLWILSLRRPKVLAFRAAYLGFHTLMAVVLAGCHLLLIQATIAVAGSVWNTWGALYAATSYLSVRRFGMELIIYGFVYGASGFLYTHMQRRREAFTRLEIERQLTQAQLKALQMQMEPHFLFNTLNSITSLVTQGRNIEANRTLSHLNTILRTTLQRKAPEKVPFTEELRVVESYLAIQQVRFSDRLSIRIDATEDARQCLVPSFILQPLVENAVQHGIAHSEAGGMIETTAKRIGDDLWLQVRDNGLGEDSPLSTGHGIGLRNTQERLAYFYPGTHRLTAGPLSSGGFEVTIQIPYEQVVA
ncbi:sensor histidine kinase [Granulicella cerasi]|uniref:Sensor histidine kinase n=1 Tax=Granulicella cerasi TaxID=741063 RepID=A0ABW1Z800_9BACT|nr:histidine kinase [Granulicella cerasi]